MRGLFRHPNRLPALSFGIGMSYLCLLVLLPLGCLAVRAAGLPWDDYRRVLCSDDTLAALRLSIGLSFLAALFNTLTGVPLAWVLSRYRFPGRGFLDIWIDLPFALPTAVAGIALCALYGPAGSLGKFLARAGIEVAYTPLGIWLAMVFVGLPFVVRAVQPVILNLDTAQEEAARCLGAGRWTCFRRVVFPELLPAVLAGFSMALSRGIGEYGSVIFIAGNIPGETEILPLRIVHALESYDFAGATVLAGVMLAVSFLLLLAIHFLGNRPGGPRS